MNFQVSMTEFNLTGFLIFVLIGSITPGPNNYLLLAHGKNFGFKDSGELILGILFGFLTILYVTGYGVAGIITTNPIVKIILQVFGSLWLLYLGYAISKPASGKSEDKGLKINFVQAFMLQFVNVKAWLVAVAGAAVFMPNFTSIHINVFVFAAIYIIIGIPCIFTWIFLGDSISKLLKSEKSNRVLGYVLFALMVVSVITIWI